MAPTTPHDVAVRNQWGGWDVRLTTGAGCTLLATDATTPDEAIARCRYWLGLVPTAP